MKIVSWNVNGLRASIRNSTKSLKGFLDSLDADIVCFQETKAKREQLDESTYSAEGYNAYFSFCKTRAGYSGVVTFCRDSVTPFLAEEGLTGVLSRDRHDSVKHYGYSDSTEEELTSLDAEGRSVITEHLTADGKGLVVVNVYCPMVETGRVESRPQGVGKVDSDNPQRMEYKINFYTALKQRCSALEKAGKLVLVVGDLNFSRETKDSAYLQEDPSLLDNSHPPREFMKHFITSTPTATPTDTPTEGCMLLDTFRYLHPTDDKAFTCWSTMLDCRKTNYGTRIDYILCTQSLSGSLCGAKVWQHVQGSDHCPVFADFNLSLKPSSSQPSLSASHFSFGKQKKVSDFFISSSSAARGSDRCLPPPAKKQKLSQKEAAAKKSSNQSLLSFVKPAASKQQSKQGTEHSECQTGATQTSTVAGEKPTLSSQGSDPPSQESQTSQKSTSGLSGAWQSILTGPPKPPLCAGHQEPCVLRTVKKQGPNVNRQFWVCARPHGSKSDPASRCDFFKWAKNK